MRKKATAKQGKKNKIEGLQQIHGKEEKYKPTTLAQIWGDDGTSKYNTMDGGEYRVSLSEMSKTDLFSHASKVGIIPVENRQILTERLVKEFKKHVASYTVPKDRSDEKNKGKISKKALDVLEEGK